MGEVFSFVKCFPVLRTHCISLSGSSAFISGFLAFGFTRSDGFVCGCHKASELSRAGSPLALSFPSTQQNHPIRERS